MDENLRNKIDRIFKDSLEAFESVPSRGVWDKIEANLDADEDRKGWFLLNRTRVTVAFLFLLVCSVGLLTLSIVNKSSDSGKHKEAISTQSPVHPIKTETAKSGLNVLDANKTSNKNVHVAGETVQDIPGHQIDNSNMIASDHETESMKVSRLQSVEFTLVQPLFVPPAFLLSKTNNSPIVLQKQKVKNRFSVTPYYSKQFAGYDLFDINDKTDPHGQEIEENERFVFSASAGFYLNYEISTRWVIQSGLDYSWSNSNIDSSTSYAALDNHGNMQYKLKTMRGYGYLTPQDSNQPNVGDSLKTAKSNSQLHYLNIPMILSYRIKLNRFSLLVGLGGTLNVLTGAEIETKTYGGNLPEKDYDVALMGLKKINYGLILKLDLQYQINKRIGVNLLSGFKNALSPINFQSDLPVYPYNVGIGLGMTYHF